ncbi:MAG: hypothetical protein M3P93_15865 [Actinomycetota bacterium]|nr:hypothetical protein [Actinomycetota bacterium]
MGGASAEAALGHLVEELGQAPVTGAVELEGLDHLRGAIRVDRDGLDGPSVDDGGDVAVTQGCQAARATHLDLAGDPHADALRGLGGVVLGLGREHVRHEAAAGGVVERLQHGDELGAGGGDVVVPEPVEVPDVPGEAVERQDDHVVKVTALAQPRAQPLELVAPHRPCRLPALDVVLDDHRIELGGLLLGVLLLHRQRQPVRVHVLVNLGLG